MPVYATVAEPTDEEGYGYTNTNKNPAFYAGGGKGVRWCRFLVEDGFWKMRKLCENFSCCLLGVEAFTLINIASYRLQLYLLIQTHCLSVVPHLQTSPLCSRLDLRLNPKYGPRLLSCCPHSHPGGRMGVRRSLGQWLRTSRCWLVWNREWFHDVYADSWARKRPRPQRIPPAESGHRRLVAAQEPSSWGEIHRRMFTCVRYTCACV